MRMSKYIIEHQEDEQLFFVALDEQRAFLRYRLTDNPSVKAEVDFFSTFVPDSHRGQGLAAQLVETGFAWADEQGLDIKASCWYAAKKLQKRQAGQ